MTRGTHGAGAGALAAIIMTIMPCAADASPLVMRHAPSDSVASRMSLLHQVLIYAKDGSKKLIDGRWNLSQSETKLGITLSPDETKQLMACTGKIVCEHPWGEVFASAVSVLRPDLLVTAKHVFAKVRGGPVAFGRCSFRSYLHRNRAIPVVVEKDQRRGYFLNNEDFIVIRLKRALAGCTPFAINGSDASLSEGEEIFSATGYQLRTLNKISGREPVLAKGKIRGVYDAYLGGAPFYYADIDLDEGGSGGAVFALKDGRPVSDDDGRLILKGILAAYGPRAKNGQPYSEERNYTIVIGLQTAFRDLVKGKAHEPPAFQPASCLQGGTAKIDVIKDPVPPAPSQMLAADILKNACAREATSACITKELEVLAKGIETLATAASRRGKGRGKEKHEFRLRNDTSCPVCFTYNRCNEYGCWDEVAMASAKSTLFAGVAEQAPVIRNPQFCMYGFGSTLADVGPQLPLRKPVPVRLGSPAIDAALLPSLPLRKPAGAAASAAGSRQRAIAPDAMFLTAKEKAQREGVWTLTEEDIRGLSLDQIRALRGY